MTVAAIFATLAFATPTNELRAALERKPNLKHGRALYEVCAACHQPNGTGVTDGSVPNIAGQHYQVILKQLTDFRDMARQDPRMEPFARHHLKSPQDLADVAAVITRMPPQPTRGFGPGTALAAGKQAYKNSCAHCHGAAAEGNNPLRRPRLAGQHYQYLLKQIDMMVGGSRFNVSWNHSQLLKSLTDDEMTGVADYLARLPASP